jgi:hypothetical protein
MANNKTVKWQVLMDAKTTEQWAGVTQKIPKGYVAVEFTTDNKTKMKVGDGVATFAELPYIESNADMNNYFTKSEVTSQIESALSTVLIFKGVVASTDALPSDDQKTGDLYIVGTADEDNCQEYVWTGDDWECLGDIIKTDLDNYYTKSEADELIQAKAAAKHTHTASDVTGLADVATSGKYSDLTGTPTVDTELSDTSENAVQNKVVKTAIAAAEGKATEVAGNLSTLEQSLAKVAKSGDYTDLSNTPVIDAVIAENDTSTNAVQTKAVASAISDVKGLISNSNQAVQDLKDSLKDVATTGSYKDLTDTPEVDSELSTASENAVQNKVVTTAINSIKEDVAGKSDSTHKHDYSEIQNTPTIDDELDEESVNAVQNKVIAAKIKSIDNALESNASDASSALENAMKGLATVATTGKYSDLTGTPTIDSALSETSENAVQNKVVNEAINTVTGKVSDVTGDLSKLDQSLAKVAKSGDYTDLSNTPIIDAAISTESTNAVQNKVVATALEGKADASHTHDVTSVSGLQDALDEKVSESDTVVINCTL